MTSEENLNLTEKTLNATTEYLMLNNFSTRIRCWGGHFNLPFPENPNPLVLCFTGNPGVTSYYQPFLRNIHKETGFRIWIISHAGHDVPIDSSKENNKPLFYNLNEQIEHKRLFIKQYIPKRVPLLIISHSIGAYITLELLKSDEQIAQMVRKAYCLFPTIENMRISPNGYWFETFVKNVQFFVIFITRLFSNYMPLRWKQILLKHYFHFYNYDENLIESTIELLQPSVLNQVIYMASDEMRQVKKLDIETIEKFDNKLRFFYGSSDGWVPKSWPQKIIQQNPSLSQNIIIDSSGFKHAFVLQDSERMSKIINSWIKEDFIINS